MVTQFFMDEIDCQILVQFTLKSTQNNIVFSWQITQIFHLVPLL